jgi:hypothetical protein
MDFESLKAIAEVLSGLHASDHGGRLETFVFIYFIVKRFTKPISSAVQKLAQGHEINSRSIDEHSAKLNIHSSRLDNHETRIVVLETDKKKGE